MREVVARHKEERPDVGHRLQQSVDGVEGQAGEGRQRVLLVVDVVHPVQAVVGPAHLVQLAVLPVHAELDAQHVQRHVAAVQRQAHRRQPAVAARVARQDEVLAQRRQQRVHRNGLARHRNLRAHRLPAGVLAHQLAVGVPCKAKRGASGGTRNGGAAGGVARGGLGLAAARGRTFIDPERPERAGEEVLEVAEHAVGQPGLHKLRQRVQPLLGDREQRQVVLPPHLRGGGRARAARARSARARRVGGASMGRALTGGLRSARARAEPAATQRRGWGAAHHRQDVRQLLRLEGVRDGRRVGDCARQRRHRRVQAAAQHVDAPAGRLRARGQAHSVASAGATAASACAAGAATRALLASRQTGRTTGAAFTSAASAASTAAATATRAERRIVPPEAQRADARGVDGRDALGRPAVRPESSDARA